MVYPSTMIDPYTKRLKNWSPVLQRCSAKCYVDIELTNQSIYPFNMLTSIGQDCKILIQCISRTFSFHIRSKHYPETSFTTEVGSRICWGTPLVQLVKSTQHLKVQRRILLTLSCKSIFFRLPTKTKHFLKYYLDNYLVSLRKLTIQIFTLDEKYHLVQHLGSTKDLIWLSSVWSCWDCSTPQM